MSLLREIPFTTLCFLNALLLAIGVYLYQPYMEHAQITDEGFVQEEGAITDTEIILLAIGGVILPFIVNLVVMISLFKHPHVIFRVLLSPIIGGIIVLASFIIAGIVYDLFANATIYH